MSNESCRVKVVCRVRPLNEKERAIGGEMVVGFPSSTTVSLRGKTFNYDHVFQSVSSQLEVYSVAARPLVKDVLSGYNATIFAYGQTSSGKTHTMEGLLNNSEMHGIIPRIVGEMFDHIFAMDANLEIHIKISYFEIYMEKIRDLLDVSKVNLHIGETKARVPYVKGITERFVTTPEEVLAVVEEGKSSRHVSVTNMNAHSSRSHAVFLITIKQESKETRKTLTGKLYLVDLAGSEKVDKTNAQGLTLDEAKTINKSLLSLSNVISALSDGNKPFIPYRDSKLTRVLQESLGGNARTTLIICCSPSSFNEAETRTTLMFGDRAKSIKNIVAVNVELTAEEWRRRYEKEKSITTKLRSVLSCYEEEVKRWRAGESVPDEERACPKGNIFQSESSIREGALAASTLHETTPTSSLAIPTATPTPTQSRAVEEERTRLCQQLDEKEEELQSRSEMVESLSLKLEDMEEVCEALQEENATIRKQITVIEQELLSSQEEVHEVMQALEELALSYDTKDRQFDAIHTEKVVLAEENERIQGTLEERLHELNQLQESTNSEKRKRNEIFSSIFREVTEVSSLLSTKTEEWLPLSASSSSFSIDVTEENFTKVKVQLSNMRCEARSLSEQRRILEQAEREAKEKAGSLTKELATCKAKLSQYGSQNEILNSTLKRSKQQKSELEESLHSLETQLEGMKGREEKMEDDEGRMEEGSRERRLDDSSYEHSSMELYEVRKEFQFGYRHQLSTLKEEIVAKETQIAGMNDQYRAQLLEISFLQSKISELDRQYSEEREHYSSIQRQMRVREKVKHDLGGLSNTVSHELDRLNQLRQAYIRCMTMKLKGKNADDSMVAASPGNRELQFLERNLEEITRAHKKTVSENAEMQREIPRLHTVLATKSKRIGELENLLRETKEMFSTEYDRLRQESEKMRKSFMSKLKEKEREYHQAHVVRRQGPQIVRPVVAHKVSHLSPSLRDTLLAGAGVKMIGQREKPHQLIIDQDPSSPAASDVSSYLS